MNPSLLTPRQMLMAVVMILACIPVIIGWMVVLG